MLAKEADEGIEPYIFKYDKLCISTGLKEDDGQSFGIVTKMEKSFEARYNGEWLLNADDIDLLQQKELIDELLFGAIEKQGQFLVEEGDEDQHEELICETSVEDIEPYFLKLTIGLWMQEL